MATVSRAILEHKLLPTLTLARPEDSAQNLVPNALNPATRSFTSSSDPPATQYFCKKITLASDETIDLSSWTDTEGYTKDSDGLKVQVFRAICHADNAADITIAGGDSDPYELFGSGNEADLVPDSEKLEYFADGLANVGVTSGVTATDIKVSGTAGDIVWIEMLSG